MPGLVWALGIAVLLAACGFGIVKIFDLTGQTAKLVIAGFCLLGAAYFLSALFGAGWGPPVWGPPG